MAEHAKVLFVGVIYLGSGHVTRLLLIAIITANHRQHCRRPHLLCIPAKEGNFRVLPNTLHYPYTPLGNSTSQWNEALLQ
jgi:hypothetical protein